MLLDNKTTTETKIGLKEKILTNPWSDSFVEVFITLAISNFAIIIAAVVALLLLPDGADSGKTIIEIAYKSLRPTELTVYIFGFIAPTIWIMFRHMRYWKHTTLWVVMLLAQIAIILFATIIFSLAISESLRNISLAEKLLAWCFAIALLVWYSSLVYQKKFIDDPASQIKRLSPGGDRPVSLIDSLESERDKYE